MTLQELKIKEETIKEIFLFANEGLNSVDKWHRTVTYITEMKTIIDTIKDNPEKLLSYSTPELSFSLKKGFGKANG